jgi:hypothetical protein
MTHDAAAFQRLDAVCAAAGPEAMLEALAAALADQSRWHAVFDVRLMQARLALGLPVTGDLGAVPATVRNRLDERSLAACREVGWPLLEDGQIAAAWMYLRAAADPAELAARLEKLVPPLLAADAADEESARRLQEIVGLALWEGADPALGISIVLRTHGTCNAITAYEQAVARLPATRQRPAARALVAHLHRELLGAVAADLRDRGRADVPAEPDSIVALLAAAGGLTDDPRIHLDVSHLQSVLRIARVCDDPPTLERAWELAVYGCRLPADAVYRGEPPFEQVSQASRHFFGALLGHDVDAALAFFRRAAASAAPEAGTLPADVLVLLLWRLGRPAEAFQAALDRPSDEGMASTLQAAGLLPSVVELAAAADAWETLRTACIARGDEITYAAALVAERSAAAP